MKVIPGDKRTSPVARQKPRLKHPKTDKTSAVKESRPKTDKTSATKESHPKTDKISAVKESHPKTDKTDLP